MSVDENYVHGNVRGTATVAHPHTDLKQETMPPSKLLSDCRLSIACFLQFSHSTCGQLFSVSAREYCFCLVGVLL
jgi:hypothetical protein